MKKAQDHQQISVPVPGALRTAQVLWLVAGLLFVGFGAFLVVEQIRGSEFAVAQMALVLLFLAAGIACAVLGYGLFLARRSARAQLTFLGLVAALPLLLRFGRFSPAAAVVLLCVVLMWLPASNRYFARVSPKPRRNTRR